MIATDQGDNRNLYALQSHWQIFSPDKWQPSDAGRPSLSEVQKYDRQSKLKD